MKELNKLKMVVTHGGKFHADEVFSTAFLLCCKLKAQQKPLEWREGSGDDMITVINTIISPVDCYNSSADLTVCRVNRIDGYLLNAIENADFSIVYDIGLGRYDHHQKNAEVRENDVPYAAFGLLYRDYGFTLFDDPEYYEFFEKNIVQQIDATDNGKNKTFNMISSFISQFMPDWDDDNLTDNECFVKAVRFAFEFIVKYVKKMQSVQKAYFVCERNDNTSVYAGSHILVLDKYVPYNEYGRKNGKWAAVYPSLRGGYCACVVSDEFNNNVAKFPKEWRGASPEELKKESSIETLTFCHPGGFIVSTETRDDAIKAARFAHPINLEGDE